MNSIPNFARSLATITSKGRIIVMPMPTAAPLTAAIRGFDSRTSATQSTSRGMPTEPPPSPAGRSAAGRLAAGAAAVAGGVVTVEALFEGVAHVGARAEAASGAGHHDRAHAVV